VQKLSELAVGFARAVDASGVDTPVSAVSTFARALEIVGLERPGVVFWAGHSVFVRRHDDTELYAAAFNAFFGEIPLLSVPRPSAQTQPVRRADDAVANPDEDTSDERTLSLARYSSVELLRDKDFASCTPEELAQLHHLMEAMRHRSPRVRTRRRVPVRRSRGPLDLRRTVRETLRSGGETVRLRRLGRSERNRRLVMLVDVSGSMEPYAREFLHFVHSAIAARPGVEAFALGTRLTRLTRELSWKDPDAAMARATAAIPDISGGTRLGEGLGAFNDRFGVAGMARRAVVVILSDGWDRGDPGRIATEMARLSRVSERIVWVNPLKATEGYEPIARGMAAALPFVDDFVEGHSLSALERLVDIVSGPEQPAASAVDRR
jgi:uncharacterized protein with von Willebrand factor type A (vWA) domain